MRRTDGILPIVMLVAVAGACALPARASQPIPMRVLPEGFEDAFAHSVRISDPTERETSLRTVLGRYLFLEDRGLAWEVGLYLQDNERWLDLRAFEGLFRQSQFARVLLELAATNALRQAPREERLARYCQALREGSATLENGSELQRVEAVMFAAGDGILELKPDIEEHFPELLEPHKEQTPLEYILLILENRAGGRDREDAARLAAGRLAGLPDAELRDRADSEPVFARVLVETSKFVCEVNPFSGWQNPGCDDVFDLFRRQMDLERKLTRRPETSGEEHSNTLVLKDPRPEWLQWLAHLTRVSRGADGGLQVGPPISVESLDSTYHLLQQQVTSPAAAPP